MQCKNCGALLNAESEVCTMCGAPVEKVPAHPEVVNVQNDEKPEVVEEVSIQEPGLVVTPTINSENISEGVAMFNGHHNDYEPKKSKFGIVVLVGIIIVVLVGLLGFVFYLTKSPKMIFNGFINKMYKSAQNVMVDLDTVGGSFAIQTNISTNDESNEILNIINDIFVEFDYELDYNNKTAFTKISTKYDDEKLIDLDVYLKDSTGYVLLKDIYSKYISVALEEDIDSIFESVKYLDDQKIVLSELKTAITKSLKSEYFATDKEKITINNQKVNTTKNSLELDNIDDIATDFLTYLKNSNKFINSASKILNISEAEVQSNLEESLSSLKEDQLEATYDDTELSIYTKGLMNEVVMIELSMEVDDKEEYLRFTVEDVNNINIEISSSEINLNGHIKMTKEEEKDIIELTLEHSQSDMKLGLIFSYSVDYNQKLNNVDVNNSVDVNSLTEDEYNEISTKLMEIPGVQKLFEALNGLSFGYEDPSLECVDGVDCYYEDDYYYDDNFYYDDEYYYDVEF